MNAMRWILMIGLLWITANAWAQDTTSVEPRAQDVLYLRNGSVLKGELLHYIHGEEIEFRLSTGDRVVIPESKIKRLVQGGGDHIKPGKSYNFKEEGTYFSVMGGITMGRTSRSNNTLSGNLMAAAGHLFNRIIGVGGGFAVDAYFPSESEILYPVFAEARGYMSATRYAPFYTMRLGYGFAFSEDSNGLSTARGGIFLNPAIGLRWGGSATANFVTELGFQYQEAEFERPFGAPGEVEIQKKAFKRLNIRLGFVF